MQITLFESFCAPAFVVMAIMVAAIDYIVLVRLKVAELYGTVAVRRRSVTAVMFFLYATSAAAFSVLTDAETASDAASYGAFVGGVVFFIYNVTAYVINVDHKEWVVFTDTAYGALTWALLFFAAHAFKKSSAC